MTHANIEAEQQLLGAVLGYSAAGSVAVTAMFFGLSFARSFVLRVIFRRLAWR